MEYVTPVVRVEGLYPSMDGPSLVHDDLKLFEEQGQAELLWLTGYRAEMVGPDGREPRSGELMCHNSLHLHWKAADHSQVLGSGYYETPRLFTLAQGQSRLDLPPGFGSLRR